MKKQTSNNSFQGELCIVISGAVAHSALVVTALHGICEFEREKAIELKLDGGATLWLPKKALVAIKSNYPGDKLYRLAKWFKFSQKQEIVVKQNQSISGVSCP